MNLWYTTSITPTTPAIEISPPCDVSFSVTRRIRFLVANVMMASSKDLRASADLCLLLMMLYSIKVINIINFFNLGLHVSFTTILEMFTE